MLYILRRAYLRPANALLIAVDTVIFWQVDNVTEVLIHCRACRLYIDTVDVACDDAVEGLVDLRVVMAELKIFTQIVTSEGEGAACVLFFGETVKVGGETNLCFDLFLATAVVEYFLFDSALCLVRSAANCPRTALVSNSSCCM